jgi:hypothetical protein
MTACKPIGQGFCHYGKVLFLGMDSQKKISLISNG